jgi:hypothetical protein
MGSRLGMEMGQGHTATQYQDEDFAYSDLNDVGNSHGGNNGYQNAYELLDDGYVFFSFSYSNHFLLISVLFSLLPNPAMKN